MMGKLAEFKVTLYWFPILSISFLLLSGEEGHEYTVDPPTTQV